MKSVTRLLVSLVVVLPLFAATLPKDIENTLNKVEKALAGKSIMASIKFTMIENKETTEDKGKIIVDAKRTKMRSEFLPQVITVFDGETLWMYSAQDKIYRKEAIPEEEKQEVINQALYLICPSKGFIMEKLKPIKATQKQTTLDGKKAVLLQFSNKEGETLSLWVDAKTYLPLQQKIEVKEANRSITSKILQLTLNPSLPQDTFVFKPPEGAKEIEIPPPSAEVWEGKSIPDFTLPSLSGESVPLSSFKGQVVLIDFWASRCGPCQMEMPIIQKLYNDYKDKGLVVLAINCGEEKKDVEEFIKNNNYTFPVLLDKEGEVSAMLQVTAIPRLLVLNKDGVVVKDITGYNPENEKILRELLENLGVK